MTSLTVTIDELLSTDMIKEAEYLMQTAFESNDRSYAGNLVWLETQQRKVLAKYCEKGEREGAKRVIEMTKDPNSQKGRIEKFNRTFPEQPYDGRLAKSEPEPFHGDVTDTATFRLAIRSRTEENRVKAVAWIQEIRRGGAYKNMAGDELKVFIRHRMQELLE
jgi:hypothetical protein